MNGILVDKFDSQTLLFQSVLLIKALVVALVWLYLEFVDGDQWTMEVFDSPWINLLQVKLSAIVSLYRAQLLLAAVVVKRRGQITFLF